MGDVAGESRFGTEGSNNCMLYKVTYTQTSHEIATGPGPFTTERTQVSQRTVYVESGSISRVPDAIAGFCNKSQILSIEKLADKVYTI